MTARRRGGSAAGRRRERGLFSFVEILLASLVLALSATATAYWVETVNSLTYDADRETIASSLVKIVEGVVSTKAFRERPGSTGIGPESGETLATYDDIDDFHGLTSAPPFDAELLPMTSLANWKTTISVQGYDPTTGQPRADGSLRLVVVTVLQNDAEVDRAAWLRARSPFE